MDFKTKLSGLNELLSIIYGDGMQLGILLANSGSRDRKLTSCEISIWRRSLRSFWRLFTSG